MKELLHTSDYGVRLYEQYTMPTADVLQKIYHSTAVGCPARRFVADVCTRTVNNGSANFKIEFDHPEFKDDLIQALARRVEKQTPGTGGIVPLLVVLDNRF
jgi:hypothetical protein